MSLFREMAGSSSELAPCVRGARCYVESDRRTLRGDHHGCISNGSRIDVITMVVVVVVVGGSGIVVEVLVEVASLGF